jgi:L-asparaginase
LEILLADITTPAKPRIAVFSGPTATIQNSEPLVTSNKAREKYGLLLRANADGTSMHSDVLRAQRIAAPVTVYIEQFSAHPLEHDAADLYAPPDGYLDARGVFQKERTSSNDKPVYEVTLKPEDGLYPLPYMARQANGRAWEGDGTEKNAPAELCRVPFFPDGSRLFEEIDRLGISDEGVGCLLSAKAEFDFYRALPSGGYSKGLSESLRTDIGAGDIAPERRGDDFFPYRPGYLRKEPPMAALARVTNVIHAALSSGKYLGGIWLEGSPFVEETIYWLNLLIDTTVPIVGILRSGRTAPSAMTATETLSMPSITLRRGFGLMKTGAISSGRWPFSMSRSSLLGTCRRLMRGPVVTLPPAAMVASSVE